MTVTIRDLAQLPPLLSVWEEGDHDVPTAGELLGVRSRATAYRLAKDWPTIRLGGRMKVQTLPLLRDVLGFDITNDMPQETDVTPPPDR